MPDFWPHFLPDFLPHVCCRAWSAAWLPRFLGVVDLGEARRLRALVRSIRHIQFFTRFTFVTNLKLGSVVVGQVRRGRAMSSAGDGVWLACMRSGRRESPGGRKTTQWRDSGVGKYRSRPLVTLWYTRFHRLRHHRRRCSRKYDVSRRSTSEKKNIFTKHIVAT